MPSSRLSPLSVHYLPKLVSTFRLWYTMAQQDDLGYPNYRSTKHTTLSTMDSRVTLGDKLRTPSGDCVANVEHDKIHVKYGERWTDQYVVGPPIRTQRYSQRELAERGFVGVYLKSR